jgi:prophage regulatory protein
MDTRRLLTRKVFVMRLFRLNQVKEITGLSRSSLYQMMDKGLFPRSINIGPRAIAWTDISINEWIESRINASK